MPHDLGLLVLPEQPVPAIVERARRAEAAGYDSIWMADEKFYRDPWVVLSAVAAGTSRLRLGTGVTEPYSRHPALIAMAMATLAEVAEGRRLVIGLGSGGPGFPPMGVTRRRPTRAIADAVAILRGLLAGERVDHDGEVISFRGGSLAFPSGPLPVYVAARGERVLATAGAVGDGVILGPFASREALEYAIGIAAAGAQRAGRPRPRMVARVDVCVGRTREEARDAVRYFVALPLWVSHPNWRYAEALGIRLSDELDRLMARRDYRDIHAGGALLPPEMIDHFAIAGTAEEVAERIRSLLPLVDELIVHPVAAPGIDVDAMTDRVAEVWGAVANESLGRA